MRINGDFNVNETACPVNLSCTIHRPVNLVTVFKFQIKPNQINFNRLNAYKIANKTPYSFVNAHNIIIPTTTLNGL